MNKQLSAWSNGYDVVAAHSADEAREVLRRFYAEGDAMDDDAIEGDGFRRVDPTRRLTNDSVDGGSVQSVLDESPLPRHLWSVEQ